MIKYRVKRIPNKTMMDIMKISGIPRGGSGCLEKRTKKKR